MKKLIVLLFIVQSITIKAQNVIDWDGVYQIQLSDFQLSSSQIGETNVYSIISGTSMEFAFYMSNAEFMFTKSFNSKVSNSFKRESASIIAPDTSTALNLLSFAQYQFDLSELYARKFRKELYDGKAAFSDVSFYQPLFTKIQNSYSLAYSESANETDLGRNTEKLRELHQQVKKDIVALADFCKTCKPIRKKK